jgi:dimethylargininase
VLTALTRAVSPSLAACELTHLSRQPIDVDRASGQHAAYEAALQRLGAQVVRAAPAPDLPDAVFIEDTAVVLDEVAVLTRPGATPRRKEISGVAAALQAYRPLLRLDPPATLDGGDVLRLGRTLYVGFSSRSNPAGVAQLRELAGHYGYRVIPAPVERCLHLKSAVTAIGEHAVLLNPEWVTPALFPGLEILEVDPGEPGSANALWLDGTVIYPDHFPRTAQRLVQRGLRVLAVPCDELAKAEGGVTCCSLLLHERASTGAG